jgi:hypothetical protein
MSGPNKTNPKSNFDNPKGRIGAASLYIVIYYI